MTETLAPRIGVSTLFMPDEGAGLLDAIDRIHQTGWRCIEVVPGAFQGHTGFPKTRRCVGVDLDEITNRERDTLVESLSRFDTINVHSMHADTNVASRNAGIRKESARQHMLSAELAADVGAQSVTFHIGLPNRGETIGDETFVIEQDVEFGKRVAAFCEKHDLVAGYENLGSFPTLDQMGEIIEKIASPRFGLHLDVGHAWLIGPTDPLEWVRALGDRTVVVHVHGTYHRPDRGFENHQSLELDDCTDLPGLLAELDARDFRGPFIFEMLAKDQESYLAMAARSRDIMLSA